MTREIVTHADVDGAGLALFWWGRRRAVEEVPHEDGVVVWRGHDLELVKLQPEHTPRVLLGGKTREREQEGKGHTRVQAQMNWQLILKWFWLIVFLVVTIKAFQENKQLF